MYQGVKFGEAARGHAANVDVQHDVVDLRMRKSARKNTWKKRKERERNTFDDANNSNSRTADQASIKINFLFFIKNIFLKKIFILLKKTNKKNNKKSH